MLFMEECSDGAAYGVQRCVVQRRCSGDTADAVGAKKLFGHRIRKGGWNRAPSENSSTAGERLWRAKNRCAREETLYHAADSPFESCDKLMVGK